MSAFNSPLFTILGAGVAGLAAGHYLASRGVPVRIFESDDQVGGMAVTLERYGYRFDLGPHRFHTREQQVLGLVQELLGDELIVHQRLSRVRLDGRYLDYPPNIPSLMRSIKPHTSARCLLDFMHASWRQGRQQPDEPDFESWVVGRFGRHLYDIYFGPYTRKVWGQPPHLLSAELARRRITVPNLSDVLLRLMFSSKDDPGPYVTQFWYPRDGIGRIAERLAEEISARQSEVLLGHRVEAIHLSGNRVEGVSVSHRGERRTFSGESFFSSLPLPALIGLIDPPVEFGLQEAAAALSYRALLFVYVLLDNPGVTDEHWLYFPEAHIPYNRVTEPRNFSPTHAPAGKTSLCAEITCDLGDATWGMPAEELATQVIHHLAEANLLIPSQVEGFFVHRTPWGYPLYAVGFERHLGRLMNYIQGVENLTLFGRQGGFDYSNMADAITSGLSAAKASFQRLQKAPYSRVSR